jgi:hypothetical protein
VKGRFAVYFTEMCSFQNHSHGLVWNPRGEDFSEEEMSSNSSAAEDDPQADS